VPGLAERTARAAGWRLAGSATAAALQLAVGVWLARLLPPSDFGLVSLAAIVVLFVKPAVELGLGSAVVQRPVVTDRHLRAAFTWSVLVGVSLASLVALAAPLAAALAGDARIASILRALALTLPLRALGVVAEAQLGRALDFRRLSMIEIVSSLVGNGAVAVALALSGLGLWSLVWGAIVQTATASAAQLFAARHSLRPLFGRREIGDLLPVGVGSALSGWVNAVALNGDNFIIGRTLGAASLGLYGRAYALMNLPFTYTAGVLSGVLFPAFAQVQHDRARLGRGYLLATELTAIVSGPVMAALAVAAPHAIPVLYGEQWSGAVAPLQVLCAAGYFRALYHLGGAVLKSQGRVYTELWLQIGYASFVVIGTAAAVAYGLTWAAVAVAAAIVFMFAGTAQAALGASGTSWAQYLHAQRAALITTGATLVVAIIVRRALEMSGASSIVISCGIAAAALVPWAIVVRRTWQRVALE
jgi:teichuronic acid exporter